MFSILALNHEEIKWNPERVSNIKPFMNKYNWKGINYPQKIDDWKTFEKNNLTIAVNILFIKEKEIRPALKSLLMIKIIEKLGKIVIL